MLIRVRSKDGTFRFEVPDNASMTELAAKIHETAAKDADPTTICVSSQPRGAQVANISTLLGQTLRSLGLKHGDLIYITYSEHSGEQSTTAVPLAANGNESGKRIWETVVEDSVDTYWRKQDGKIARSRDSRFCKHGSNAMCDYCMPLEPFDTTYHTSHSIKHLSYHAYLRKISPPSSSTSSTVPPLTPLTYKVKSPCPNASHPPWPLGICTACQPPAITLQPQTFRMTDHVEFADPTIVDRFIDAWRSTGVQRFGWLIGRYEPYDEVPMGVKAVVEAIHEPPQEGEIDGLSISLPWEDQTRIQNLALAAVPTPLYIVGQIFTDLTALEEDRTKQLYKRHPDSFYLSSLEIIFAASMQLSHPTKSKSSPTGSFSSRFVSLVITGNGSNEIDIAAYQASEQACAMVEADMIEASVDPGIVRVKEEDRTVGSSRYVPDVFFRYKNEYGIEVKKSARPCFPVEYLLVNVTHGFPTQPSPVFRSPNPFPIENRPGLQDQSVDSVLSTLARLHAVEISTSANGNPSSIESMRNELATWLSDWHLVAFLGTMGVLDEEDVKHVLKVATAPPLGAPDALNQLIVRDGWQNLIAIVRESARPVQSGPAFPVLDDDIPQDLLDSIAAEDSGSSNDRSMSAIKTCPHCTFENPADASDCEVCGLPL